MKHCIKQLLYHHVELFMTILICTLQNFGFQKELDQQLGEEFKVEECPEWQKHVGLVLDKMKIKEGIVYIKHSSTIEGFINLGEITNQLQEFEDRCMSDDNETYTAPLAKYVNCFMVRGIFQ